MKYTAGWLLVEALPEGAHLSKLKSVTFYIPRGRLNHVKIRFVLWQKIVQVPLRMDGAVTVDPCASKLLGKRYKSSDFGGIIDPTIFASILMSWTILSLRIWTKSTWQCFLLFVKRIFLAPKNLRALRARF